MSNNQILNSMRIGTDMTIRLRVSRHICYTINPLLKTTSHIRPSRLSNQLVIKALAIQPHQRPPLF